VTTRRRPRVAIAVQPTILGDALTSVLRDLDVDEVVNLREPHDTAPPADFDAAVVTIVLPDAVDADVVIELPDTPTGDGPTTVRHHDRCETVAVTALADILRLLDDYCPSTERRRTEPT
jgi:hypothetical protein